MGKTLMLSRRCHLFIKDDELFIKLQRPNPMNEKKDLYIIKRFPLGVLVKIRDWANENLGQGKEI